jgi:hypothetical protein
MKNFLGKLLFVVLVKVVCAIAELLNEVLGRSSYAAR